jgi:WD40 repeat protein
MYSRLAEAASMYQVGKAGLWRPPDLQLALNWQAKHKPTLVWGQRYNPAFERTMIFLEYSKKEWETEQRIKELEQKRKLQRARTFALVLGTFTIIAIIFLVFALYAQANANRQKEAAERALIVAAAAEKKATAEKLKADEQARLAVAAKEEAEAAQLAEAEQRKKADAAKLESDRNAELARRNESTAKANEKRANLERERAEKNEEEAIRQGELARKNAEEALRMRYIAQAKAMAVKSKELNDPQQQALIAQQAFKFNAEHKGYVYDNDIYNGLYFALTKFDHPLTKSLKAHDNGAARALVTHTGNNSIYSAGSDGKIIRWDEKQGQWNSQVLVKSNNYQYYTIDVSTNGKILVAAGLNVLSEQQNYVEVYNLDNMAEAPRKIEGYSYAIENICITPEGDGFFARDNSGKSIKFSDLKTSKEVIHATVKINAIALSPDGSLLAGAGENGTMYLWDVKNNYAVREVPALGNPLTSVEFGPEGRRIVTGDNVGIVKIYDNQAGLFIRTLSGHTSGIEQIRFNHGGTFMATASKDKTVRLWNMDKLREQPIVLSDHKDWVWSATFTPDDEQLLASVHSSTETVKGVEHTIRAWPTKIPTMSNILCGFVKRNIDTEEWETFAGNDLPYESTCPDLPGNNNK